MEKSSSSSSWQSVARRKQAERDSKIPSDWRVASRFLPRDPPKLEDGPQNVLHVPRECGLLSAGELSITEDHNVQSILGAMAAKKLRAVDVARAFCKRAAIAHQLTNCLTEPLFESAIRRAEELDHHLAKEGKLWGPLHGLPVSVKDTFNVRGVDTSIGLAALCFKPAPDNAPLVDLLLSLGCVIVAKTNVPQLLASLDSQNNVFGRTMNPINRLVTAGGSSGGEGVMVAMKASMMGWGTDVGGSIRIPTMCNGIYGFKPANGRIPYGGQALISADGMSRCSITAVAGALGRSVEDLDLVLREVIPRTSLWGEDCIPAVWHERPTVKGSGPNGEVVFGLLRGDGNCELLPPIAKLLDEVSAKLRSTPNVKVVELPTPPAWTKAQSLLQKLISMDAGEYLSDLLEATGEPLVPWQQSRFRRGKPRTLKQAAGAQASRTALEQEMMKIWIEQDDKGQRKTKIDALLCGVAPHPVPEIDRYNAVGFTSSWVLFDYPAGTVPVRDFTEQDLELGKPLDGKPVSSWDERNRQLWDEKTVDRRVYLGTPLSVQVVTPRLEDQRLLEAMRIVDNAVHGGRSMKSRL